jgi:hypothetical protein
MTFSRIAANMKKGLYFKFEGTIYKSKLVTRKKDGDGFETNIIKIYTENGSLFEVSEQTLLTTLSLAQFIKATK